MPFLWQVTGTSEKVLLTNGQTAPTLTIAPNTWYRFRICFSAATVGAAPTLSFNEDSTCEMQLLAKDGIYLQEAPRSILEIPLFPGARADVAVRCTTNGTATLFGYRDDSVDNNDDVQDINEVARPLNIIVSGADGGATNLESFSVKRPCYLADTRAGNPDATT